MSEKKYIVTENRLKDLIESDLIRLYYEQKEEFGEKSVPSYLTGNPDENQVTERLCEYPEICEETYYEVENMCEIKGILWSKSTIRYCYEDCIELPTFDSKEELKKALDNLDVTDFSGSDFETVQNARYCIIKVNIIRVNDKEYINNEYEDYYVYFKKGDKNV